jgi:tRNA threonylcarbamoyladenosine biosynthesis protein TsaE
VLLNVYDTGRLKVFHLDAYRVGGPEDFESIGFLELLEQGGVVAVEWPERVERLIPKNCVTISMQPISEKSRRIAISR